MVESKSGGMENWKIGEELIKLPCIIPSFQNSIIDDRLLKFIVIYDYENQEDGFC